MIYYSYMIYVKEIGYYYGYTTNFRETVILNKLNLKLNKHQSYTLQECYNHFPDRFLTKNLYRDKDISEVLRKEIILKYQNKNHFNIEGLKYEVLNQIRNYQFFNKKIRIEFIYPSQLINIYENEKIIGILLGSKELEEGNYMVRKNGYLERIYYE